MFCQCKDSSRRYLFPLGTWEIVRHEYTPYEYSRIRCRKCGNEWLTRAAYAKKCPNRDRQQIFKFKNHGKTNNQHNSE